MNQLNGWTGGEKEVSFTDNKREDALGYVSQRELDFLS